MGEKSHARRPVRAVRHVVNILRCISQSGSPVGVNELARRVSLDKSSVSRLLDSLEEERLVRRGEDGRLQLEMGLLAIAAPLMGDLNLSARVRPSLEALAKSTGETVNLSVWSGNEAVSIVQALGSNAITHFATPGRTNPAHSSASGKVLLTFEPQEVIDRVLAGPLQRYTEHTVTDPDVIRDQLRAIRAHGYAVNEGELASDVCAVSAPIFRMDGRLVGALTVTVPAYRFDEERQAEIISQLLPAARDLSAQFGYRS